MKNKFLGLLLVIGIMVGGYGAFASPITINIGPGGSQGGTTVITEVLAQTGNNFGGQAFFTPPVMSNANSIQLITSFLPVISAGHSNTVITVPVLAAGVVIIPQGIGILNATDLLTIKGVAGDTGIRVNSAGPTTLPFNATPPTSFVIDDTGTTGSVTDTAILLYFF